MENKDKMIQLALIYLSRGWSIIPVGNNKIPLVTWKKFQTQRATPEEFLMWWDQYPEAQIGIVTGRISNLVVIDAEADGDLDFIKDETYTVKTGGGGKHWYLTYEPEFKNSVRVFPHIDQRGEGGYVVAAGSTSTKGAYTVINDLPVAKMSKNTKKLFLEALKASRNVLPWYATSGQSPYPKMSESGLDYQGSGEGGRNDAMTKFAGSIHAKLHPSLWATIGWQMFEAANSKNSPSLSSYEVRTIWNSIGQKEVRANPYGRDYSQSVSGNKTWGPAPEGEKGEKQLDDSHSESNNAPAESDPKESLHASEVADLQIIDSENFFPLDMKPFDDVLLGGFSLGDVVIVAGQTGCGKTTIMQDWSVTLSSGGQTKREKLPSLWFSYEVLARPLWQKFQIMGADINTPIYMPRFNESGDTEWVVDVIEKAIVKWGIKVVCIDHLGFLRAPKGNYSNAADAITETVRALKRLAIKRGLIILLPVHVRKTNAKIPDLNDIRSSLGIAQEADTVFFIGREKDDFGLSTNQSKIWLIKNRKTGVSTSAVFDFAFGRFYYDADSDKKSESSQNSDAVAALKAYDDWVK